MTLSRERTQSQSGDPHLSHEADGNQEAEGGWLELMKELFETRVVIHNAKHWIVTRQV